LLLRQHSFLWHVLQDEQEEELCADVLHRCSAQMFTPQQDQKKSYAVQPTTTRKHSLCHPLVSLLVLLVLYFLLLQCSQMPVHAQFILLS
jgi:hypothetical protein